MYAPEIEAVRVPPSAFSTSQSTVIITPDNFFKFKDCLKDLPINL